MASSWLRVLAARFGYRVKTKAVRPPPAAARRRRLRLEALEGREVPATYYWVGAANSSDPNVVTAWSNPANWDTNGFVGVAVPGPNDVAMFSASVPAYTMPADSTQTLTAPVNQTPTFDGPGGNSVGGLNFDATWAGNLTVMAALTIANVGEWDAGTITVSNGTTLTNAGNVLVNGPGVVLAGGGQLVNTGSIAQAGSNTLSINGSLSNQAGGYYALNNDSNLTGGGSFTNAGTLIKSTGAAGGSSTVVASLTFSNSGQIDVEQGTLRIAAAGTSTGGTFKVQAGATLDLSGGATVDYQGIYIGTFTSSMPGTIRLGGGTLQLAGTTTFSFPPGMFHWTGGTLDTDGKLLTNTRSLTLDNAAGVPDVLAGNGSLVNAAAGSISQGGAGGLTLAGTSGNGVTLVNRGLYDITTDSGVTTAAAGGAIHNLATFRKSSGNGISTIAVGLFDNTGTVFAQGGTFDIRAVQQVSGTLLTGGFWGVATPATLTLNGGAAFTNLTLGATAELIGVDGVFANITGRLVGNSGSVTLLSGASLTAPGNFANYGTVTVASGCSFTADTLTNEPGGVVIGGGTIHTPGTAGPPMLANSGQVRPSSAGGSLVLGAGYSQDNSGNFTVQLNGTTAGSTYDQLEVAGPVTIGGTLSVSSTANYPVGTQFVIIRNDGAGPITGTFAGLPEGALLAAHSQPYSISYHGGDGNDVMLTVQPSVPPQVIDVQVNVGGAQRSEVRSITAYFSQAVTFAGNVAAAFQLANVTTGVNVQLVNPQVYTDAQGRTFVNLEFTGVETDPVSALNNPYPSLVDGRYRLTVFSNQIIGFSGQPLDGADTGVGGSDYVSPPDVVNGSGLHLYRLFGDATGDGVVDATDVGAFRSTFNSSAGSPAYLSYLDADSSGAVDASDLGQFRSRYNANIYQNAVSPEFYVNPATGDDANDGRSARAAWKTWARLIQAVRDGTIPAGTWVNGAGAVSDIGTVATTAAKDAWYAAYTAGDRQLTGGIINIDTSGAPLQVTAPLVLPPGCEIRSATDQLTDLEVEVPIAATEVWARPNAANFPNVWGTTSSTSYAYTAEYEQVAGQWAQLDPIAAANLAAALPLLESTAGSFFVDPATHELYSHALAGGDPNADGVAREVTPNFFDEAGGKMIDVTGGLAYKIGIDGGFGFKPTTGEAFGFSGIGTTEWDSISVIDSCQVSRAGKHSFESVGNQASGFAVYRDDTATLGPGGVFVGYWTHFVDFSGQPAPGSAYSIYDGCRTVAGVANVDAPGGTDDVAGGYQSFTSHNGGGLFQFAGRTFINCSFEGASTIGNQATAVVTSTGNRFGDVTSLYYSTWTSTNDTFETRLPLVDQGATATFNQATITAGSDYNGVLANLSGTVTFNGGTIDLSGADGYSGAWARDGSVALRLNNVTLKGESSGFGLLNYWQDTDTFSATGLNYVGDPSWTLFANYNFGQTGKSWQWARSAGMIDDASTLNGGPWAAKSLVSRATFTTGPGTPLAAYKPETGPAFADVVGSWAVNRNEAFVGSGTAGARNITWLNAGRADGPVTAILDGSSAGSPDAGIVFNGVDANNYWLADLNGGLLKLYVKFNGVLSDLGTFYNIGSLFGVKHTLTVDPKGNQVSVYWDDAPAFAYGMTGGRTLAYGTYVGLAAGTGQSTTFDDFEVQ
jgi:hypothetical protein